MDRILEEKLTNGGRVPLPIGTNLDKLVKADQIVEGIRKGDALAIGAFKSHLGARFGESLTTGDDFIFAYSHLNAIEVDKQFVARERNWAEVVDTQVVNTFDAPKVYSIDADIQGFARPVDEPGKPSHVPPIVPEGSPYPEFKFKGEIAGTGSIHKAGGAFGLTFERIVSDPGEIVPALPGLITEFLLDREEWDVWNGLKQFIAPSAFHLKAGTTMEGTAVKADAPINRASLDLAIQQLDLRTIGTRKLQVSSYTLIVPVGSARVANYFLNTLELEGFTEQTGTGNGAIVRKMNLNGYNPLSKISKVVESEYFEGSEWALIPTKGAIRGNKRFFNLGRLRGHEGPEVRVENVTGNYAGGGAVAPFEGSFATDSANLRGRIISGGLGWNPQFGLYSTGEGV